MAIDRQDTVYIYKTVSGKKEVINQEEWSEKAVTERLPSLDALVHSGRLVRDEPPFLMAVAGEIVPTGRIVIGSWQEAFLTHHAEPFYLGVSGERSTASKRYFLFKNSGSVIIEIGRYPVNIGDRVVPVASGKLGIFLDKEISLVSNKIVEHDITIDNSVFSNPQKVCIRSLEDDERNRSKKITLYYLDKNRSVQKEDIFLDSVDSSEIVKSSKDCSCLIAFKLESGNWGSHILFENESGQVGLTLTVPINSYFYGRVLPDYDTDPIGHSLHIECSQEVTKPVVVMMVNGTFVEYEVLDEIPAGGTYTKSGGVGRIYLLTGGDGVINPQYSVTVESDVNTPVVGDVIDVTANGKHAVVVLNPDAFGGTGEGTGEIEQALDTRDYKESVKAATLVNIAGTHSGGTVGATLTGSGSLNDLGIDGITDFSNEDRILLKNQSNAEENGIYVVLDVGTPTTEFVLVRAEDADTSEKVTSGLTVHIEEGSVNRDKYFFLETENIELGVTALSFRSFDEAITLYEVGLGVNSTQRKYVGNSASGYYSAALGGRNNGISTDSSHGFVGGGYRNGITTPFLGSSNYSAIVGGKYNWIMASYGIIGGGLWNRIGYGPYNVVVGGYSNYISASGGNSLVGGYDNTMRVGSGYFMGGGVANYSMQGDIICGKYNRTLAGVVISGRHNEANPQSLVVGGHYNFANGLDFFVGSGRYNGTPQVGVSISAFSSVVGGYNNIIDNADYCFIGGGHNNLISYDTYSPPRYSSILSGRGNLVRASYSSVSSGLNNDISPYGPFSSISGGIGHFINGSLCFVGGGNQNQAGDTYSGYFGLIIRHNSGVVCGWNNDALGERCFIGSGQQNELAFGTYNSGIVSGNNNYIGGSPNASFIGSGLSNIVGGWYSSVVGGQDNEISSNSSFIGGGRDNQILLNSTQCSIVGGLNNTITWASGAFIGGGRDNFVRGLASVLVGGENNYINDCDYSSMVGGYRNEINNSHFAFLGGGDTNIMASGSNYSVITGGNDNYINGASNTISGGNGCYILSSGSNIFGGYSNTINGSFINTIIGGWGNTLTAAGFYFNSQIFGGFGNEVTDSSSSFVIGGSGNSVEDGDHSSVVGGQNNQVVGGARASVVGGRNCTITGYSSGIFCSDTSAVTTGTGNRSVILGGINHWISGQNSAILSGSGSSVYSVNSVVVGGQSNDILSGGNTDIIAGGSFHLLNGSQSGIFSGQFNEISGAYQPVMCSIMGGTHNFIDADTALMYGDSVIGGEYNTIRDASYSGIFSGTNNYLTGLRSVILGGLNNSVSGSVSSIIAGGNHSVDGNGTTILGGTSSYVNSNLSAIISSSSSSIYQSSNLYFPPYNSTIFGGRENTISEGGCDCIVGSYQSEVTDSVLSTVVGGQFSQIIGTYQSIILGAGNVITGNYSGIVSSLDSSVFQDHGFIGGGENCYIGGLTVNGSGIVGSGSCNSYGSRSFIGGSTNSEISGGSNNVVLGGGTHIIDAYSSSSGIFSGTNNIVQDALYSGILGGYYNTVEGYSNAVIGGYSNTSDLNSWWGVTLGGGSNRNDGGQSSIIGSYAGYIDHSGVWGSSVISSYNSGVLGVGVSSYSSIVASQDSRINLGYMSFIAGSNNGFIYDAPISAIVASTNSSLYMGQSAVVGGGGHTLGSSYGGNGGGIFGGTSHNIGLVRNTGNSVIVGGFSNTVDNHNSGIVGGRNNTIDAQESVVLGGHDNSVTDIGSFVASSKYAVNGGRYSTMLSTNISEIVGTGVPYQILSFIAAGGANYAGGIGASIMSTSLGTNYGNLTAISGSLRSNIPTGTLNSVIIGGSDHDLAATRAGIFAGQYGYISGSYGCDGSVIIGGNTNEIDASSAQTFNSGVIGGSNNYVKNCSGSFILGGDNNDIQIQPYSTILGGRNNRIRGTYDSFPGTFVIAGGFGNQVVQFESGDFGPVFVGGTTNSYVRSAKSGSILSSPSCYMRFSYNSHIDSSNGVDLYYGSGQSVSSSLSCYSSSYASVIQACDLSEINTYSRNTALIATYDCYIQGNNLSQSSIIASYGSTAGRGRNCFMAGTWDSYAGTGIANANQSFIIGGSDNRVGMILNAFGCGILGGHENEVEGYRSVIIGGYQNQISTGGTTSSTNSVIVGGRRHELALTATALNCSIIGGDLGTVENAQDSVLVGGLNNSLNGTVASLLRCVIVGGENNSMNNAESSVIVGGEAHSLSNDYSVILGGYGNDIDNSTSGILGGTNNNISGDGSVILGGFSNDIPSGSNITILGGSNNTVSGDYSCVFGRNQTVLGSRSFVVGSNGIVVNVDDALVITSGNLALGNPPNFGEEFEISSVDTVADVSGSLGGTYFLLSSSTLDYYIWFSNGVDPGPIGTRIGIAVPVVNDDGANIVASKIKTVLDGLPGSPFSTVIGGVGNNELTITNVSFGASIDAGAGTSGFTVGTDQQGLDIPTQTLTIMNGTPPSAGVSGGALLYSKDDAGEAHLHTMDEAGNETKLGAHNDRGEWEFFSRNVKTGRTVKINMEEVVRDLEKLTGKKYLIESFE